MALGGTPSSGRAGLRAPAPPTTPTHASPTLPSTAPSTALERWLDARPGPHTVLGLCATADGAVAATLAARPDTRRLTASFIEDDPVSAAVTSQGFRLAGLSGLSVVHADLAQSDTYGGRVPADLVLVGPAIVDGPAVRRRGIGEALPALLAPGGHVYWWSQREEGAAAWRRTLAAVGIDAVRRGGPATEGMGRLVDRPHALRPGTRLYPGR